MASVATFSRSLEDVDAAASGSIRSTSATSNSTLELLEGLGHGFRRHRHVPSRAQLSQTIYERAWSSRNQHPDSGLSLIAS